MHAKRRNQGTATAAAILLIALGLAVGWLAVAPSVFGTSSAFDPSAARPASLAVQPANLVEGLSVASNLQVSQPRDPFRPLISEDGSTVGGPGSGRRSGIEVALISVEVGPPVLAEVEVNGVSYTVGVGDVFAGSFKVISLTPPDDSLPETDPLRSGAGVFLFGDNAFELGAGQQILK